MLLEVCVTKRGVLQWFYTYYGMIDSLDVGFDALSLDELLHLVEGADVLFSVNLRAQTSNCLGLHTADLRFQVLSTLFRR